MFIARHFVAGEVLTRLALSSTTADAVVTSTPRFEKTSKPPAPATTLTSSVLPALSDQQASADRQALDAFQYDSTNLPWIVFRAAFRAQHLSGVPHRARAVLSSLARTVDAHRPGAVIFIGRERLIDRSLLSMRTLYRALDDLENLGLINRETQRRHDGIGKYGRAYLRLTLLATNILGFTTRQIIDESTVTNEGTSPVALKDMRMKQDDVCESIDGGSSIIAPVDIDPASRAKTMPHHKAPTANVAYGAIYKDLYPTHQKRQPGTLPSDLNRLLGLGFHKYMVFKLMREAREQGKTLSQVVDATWTTLSKAHAPINYLRALLTRSTDFAAIVHQRLHTVQLASARERRTQERANSLQPYAGKTYRDATNTLTLYIDNDATILTTKRHGERFIRTAVSGWQDAFLRAIQHGTLVPVTMGETAEPTPAIPTPNGNSTPVAVEPVVETASRDVSRRALAHLRELTAKTVRRVLDVQ